MFLCLPFFLLNNKGESDLNQLVLFSVSVIKERTRKWEDRERKTGVRRPCTNYILCWSVLLKKNMGPYIALRGEMDKNWKKMIIHWDEVSRNLIKKYCTRGTQGVSNASETEYTVALGLVTPVSSGGKSRYLELKPELLWESGSSPRPDLAKSAPGKDEKLGSLYACIRTSNKALDWPGYQQGNNSKPEKMNRGFISDDCSPQRYTVY